MRLIDADAAIDAFMEILDRPYHAEFLYTDEICRVLGSLPSAQPQTGHWVVTDEAGHAKCSECGASIDLGGGEYSNYCPNCGASMKGKSK